MSFLLIKQIPYHYIFALIFFVGASITDYLDGYLARKNNQVTTFGKFLDPLADKVLVISAMVCFIELGMSSSIAVIIIIAREFMVTSLRLVAMTEDGKVISASMIGKVKTVIQMIAVITILVMLSANDLFTLPSWININLIGRILMTIAALITVISGLEY
ncbi:MAG: CDP-diacylglycerol--glycerol-3-phosphate 3-phosphatidyltransferase, partial [Oscillospiraceae bacterium]